MKKSIRKVHALLIILVLFAIVYLISNIFINVPINNDYIAENGKLSIDRDISEVDAIIVLDGEWEFYNGELLSFNKKSNQRSVIAEVPGTWNNHSIYPNMHSKYGYGTYTLDLELNNAVDEDLALYVHCIPCAYKIYVDEKLVGQSGVLGNSLETEKADIRPQIVNFSVPSDEFSITLQVSNYHFAKGGFWTNMYLGDCEKINKYSQTKIIKDVFLMGIILAVGIIYLLLYLSKYKLRQQLYFAFLCLLAILLIDFDNNMLIYKASYFMNFETMVRLWYFPSSLIPFLVVLYVVELFKFERFKMVIYVLAFLTVLNSINDLFIPTWINTGLSNISNIISALSLIFALIVVLLSVKTHKKIAVLYLISFSVILSSFIYDYMFYHTNIYDLNVGITITYAIAIVVLFQAYILAVDFDEIHKQREQAVKNVAQTELAFLQAQIKPHFLYNALSAIEDLCHSDGKRAGELITDLTFYLRSSFDFGNLKRFTTLGHELEFIKNYIHIEQARFGEKIKYIENIKVPLDISIPILILEPLIENAVNHGISKKVDGGTVKLIIDYYCDDGIMFSIEDNGIGFDQEKIELATEKGVGIENIQRRLAEIYGEESQLYIESKIGEGTKVWFVIRCIDKIEGKV